MSLLRDYILGKAKQMPAIDLQKIESLPEIEIKELAEAHISEGRPHEKMLGLCVLYLLSRVKDLENRLMRVEIELGIDPLEDDDDLLDGQE
jgi:hypothetical protein